MNARRYPIACTSAYCGKSPSFGCDARCPHYTSLQDFNAWRRDNNAVCADPIWSPNFYVVREQS